MPMNDEPIIVADGMSFRYGPEDILTDISFEIPAGGYVRILVANRIGKTTLIKLIVGLLTPAAGTLRLFGSDPRLFRGWEQVGYVPQHVFKNDQNFPATVEEIVASGLGSDERRLSKIERKTCIDRALAAARVEHVAKRRIGELSGGERQRAFIARALATQPRLLILDEPTTGLHLADVEQLLGLLDRLVDAGKSVIVIEHHQAVMAHADWIIDLGPGAGHDGGKIVFQGTPEELVAEKSTLTGQHLASYLKG